MKFYGAVIFSLLSITTFSQKVDTVLIWNRLNYAIDMVEVQDSSAVDLSKEVFELAQESGNMELIAEAANVYAEALAMFNQYDDILRQAYDVLLLADRELDYPLAAKSLQSIGNIYMKRGDHYRALVFYNRALDFFQLLGNQAKEAELQNRIGLLYKNTGDYAQSLQFYLTSLDLSRELDSIIDEADVLMNIGVLFKEQNDLNRALSYYDMALEIYTVQNDLDGIADCYTNMGVVFKNLKDYVQAEQHYQKAIAIREETGNQLDKARALHNLGYLKVLQKNYHAGLDFYFKSLEIKQTLGDMFGAAGTYLNIAEAYGYLGENKLAEEHFQIALNLSYNMDSRSLRCAIYKDYSLFYSRMGESDKAYAILQDYLALNDSILSLEKIRLISNLETLYWAERQALSDSLHLAESQTIEAERNSSAERQRTLIFYGVIAIGVLALLLLWSTYNRYRSMKKAKNELEHTRISKEEKEVLLQEVHHRVKNNLQIIISLIRLQSDQITDELSLSVLRESQNRISSMALVHEELYRTKDFANVNVKSYFTSLVEHVAKMFQLDIPIATDVAVGEGKMAVNVLIPLGLIANEILSNAFKYAFPNGKEDARVFLELKHENNNCVLTIGDNGVGMELLPDPENATLGMELIQTLTEQIDGELNIDNSNGLVYQITFNHDC